MTINFESLLAHSPNPYVVLAPDLKIVWANHAAIDAFWSRELSTLLEAMLQLKPDERPDALEAIQDPIFAPALQSGPLHPSSHRQRVSAHVPCPLHASPATEALGHVERWHHAPT